MEPAGRARPTRRVRRVMGYAFSAADVLRGLGFEELASRLSLHTMDELSDAAQHEAELAGHPSIDVGHVEAAALALLGDEADLADRRQVLRKGDAPRQRWWRPGRT